MTMEYSEVKQVFKGYAEYMALEYGTNIKFSRNKVFNEFEYWTKWWGEDVKLLSIEVGSVKDGIVMKFNHTSEFTNDFLDRYNGDYSSIYNTLCFSVYDMNTIHELMKLFGEIGFFIPRR
ncbi:hypothetical protein D3C87_81290 [compost metagenome]